VNKVVRRKKHEPSTKEAKGNFSRGKANRGRTAKSSPRGQGKVAKKTKPRGAEVKSRIRLSRKKVRKLVRARTPRGASDKSINTKEVSHKFTKTTKKMGEKTLLPVRKKTNHRSTGNSEPKATKRNRKGGRKSLT